MLRLVLVFSILCFQANYVFASQSCDLKGSKNFLESMTAFGSCPPVLEPSKGYCCPNINDGTFFCCTEEEYMKVGVQYLVILLIVGAVIVMLCTFCISCFCCRCCPWYKRRHGGTIYGKVHTPSIVHVIGAPPNATVYVNQTQESYPAQVHEDYQRQPPPQYTPGVYGKQAPYNPNYLQ